MEEKTLFAFRAPEIGKAVDETQTMLSDGGELLIKIRSRKQKIANGHVVIETTTPSCKATINESWISSRVEVDNKYNLLDVYFNIEKNTSSSERTSVITVTQDGSGLKLTFCIIQKAGVTYTGYIKMVSNTLPLGSDKDNTAQILVMAYLNGSDGSKKPETPHVGSAPDWCSVSVITLSTLENHYMLTLTALSSNQTGASRSGHIFLTCGDANLSIKVTQITTRIIANITISVFKSPTSNTSASCDIRSDQLVASSITFRLQIQYGVSSGDVREYIYTLAKDSAISRNNFAIQNEANPQLIDYSYSPQEDSKYIYSVSVI